MKLNDIVTWAGRNGKKAIRAYCCVRRQQVPGYEVASVGTTPEVLLDSRRTIIVKTPIKFICTLR